MLNKNYRKLIGKAFSGYLVAVKDIDGNTINTDINSGWNNTASSGTGKYIEMLFGSGKTPPTEDDYKMENRITLTFVSASQSNGDDNFIKSFTGTYINNTGSQVSISELGLCLVSDTKVILLARIVLSSTVTIEQGEIYAFNYTIK